MKSRIQLPSRPKAASALALIAALALASCDTLKPHNVTRDLSRVAVSFDPTAPGIGPLAAQMKTLQVRVFGLTNDVVGPQEGADQSFPIVQQQKEYDITGVHLGMKRFDVAILDANGAALGVGTLKWLVKPGLNHTDPLIIKIKSAEQQVASISLDFAFTADGNVDPTPQIKKVVLKWKTENSSQSGELELTKSGAVATNALGFADVKSIFLDNGDATCAASGCHSGAHPSAKLDLASFPFKSGKIADKATLMKAVVDRMNDQDNPMPPDGVLAADVLNKIAAWQTGGFLETAPAAGTVDKDYRAKIDGLKVTDKLSGTLIVTGENGVEIYKEDVTSYVIEQNGVMKMSCNINVAAPTVAIPIEVQPQ